MRAYHFTTDTLRDGRPIPAVGEWLEHKGEVIPCKSGLHASEHPFDALRYAPGLLLHLVELDGDLKSHGNPVDKWVGRRRKIIATVNAEELLEQFARWCALQVAHLWDAPPVVREYLETGDKSLRKEAYKAAKETAHVAAAPTRVAAKNATEAEITARFAARAVYWASEEDDNFSKYSDKFKQMVNEAFMQN
jgi:hypothetical protein